MAGALADVRAPAAGVTAAAEAQQLGALALTTSAFALVAATLAEAQQLGIEADALALSEAWLESA
jgi:hypothetical protein